ncbi:MAG: hypothetical protein C5B53_07185 [Candidatus Melainabacteria bacterium]|nr:MAG: hypothetical protein C5B53_07185 [Candidatus Melainabacteria bacterium]
MPLKYRLEKIVLVLLLVLLSIPVTSAKDGQQGSHVESVPFEVSHPEPIPAQLVKTGTGAELKGRVQRDEEAVFAALNAGMGIVVKKEGKDLLPARITTVYAGSPMARRGVAVGDRLIGEVADKGLYTITVDHNGQGMRFSIQTSEIEAYSQAAKEKLAAALNASAANPQPLKSGANQAALPALVNGKKHFSSLKDVFENHDLVMIIDRSGSMTARDCPGRLSRWDWCCSQARDLADAAAQAASTITTVFFNHEYYRFDRVRPQDIPVLFSQYQPSGGTILGQPLSEQFDDYFRVRAKPLIIAIVTDGMPNDPFAVAEALDEATCRLRYAGEVTVTFLLISDQVDEESLRTKLQERMGGSVKNGGMVDVIPFDTLVTKGVKQAFFEELRDVRLATDRTKPSKAGQFQAFTPGKPQLSPNYPSMQPGNSSYSADPVRAGLHSAVQERSDLERALLNKYH